MGGSDIKHIERFQDTVTLLRKIEVWWVVNLEIATNPDFDGKESRMSYVSRLSDRQPKL